ncbi:MAG: tetratricopeptide repeat protein [Oligoflexales bacterium]
MSDSLGKIVHPTEKLMRLYTYLCFFILGHIPLQLRGSAVGQSIDSPLSHLEKDLWQASPEELPFIEARITREIQNNPDSLMGHYLLNQFLIRSYRASPSQSYLLEQAAQIAFQTMELAPESELGVISILDTLDAMGREAEVETLLNRQQLAFSKASWRYRLAKIRRLEASQNPQHMFQELRQIMSAPESLREVVAAYVVSLLKSHHKGEDLITKLAAWHKDFPSPTFIFTMANEYATQKKFQKAHLFYKKLYQKSRYKDKGYEDEALINDGIILTKHLKRHRQAIALLKKRIKHLGNRPIRQRYSLTQLHAHLGWAYLHIGNNAQSHTHFLKSLELTENTEQMILFIQQAHHSKTHHFIHLMKKAIHNIPGNAHMHASIAQAYTKQKKFKTSQEYWENAILLQPEQSQFYTAMGLSFYHLSDYEKASLWFQRAVDINNNDAHAAYNLACMLSLTGENDGALEALEQAFQLDPSLRTYAPKDSDLKSLHHLVHFQKITQT